MLFSRINYNMSSCIGLSPFGRLLSCWMRSYVMWSNFLDASHCVSLLLWISSIRRSVQHYSRSIFFSYCPLVQRLKKLFFLECWQLWECFICCLFMIKRKCPKKAHTKKKIQAHSGEVISYFKHIMRFWKWKWLPSFHWVFLPQVLA